MLVSGGLRCVEYQLETQPRAVLCLMSLSARLICVLTQMVAWIIGIKHAV